MTLFAKLVELLKAANADDIVDFGGGIIPDADRQPLAENGVAEVFTPGARMSEIVSWVLKMWGRRGAPEHGGRRVSSLKGPPGSQAQLAPDELSEQLVDLVVGLGQRFRRSLAQQDLVHGRLHDALDLGGVGGDREQEWTSAPCRSSIEG